jgi:hypothetical protein
VDADDFGDGDAAGALLEEEDGLLAAFEEGFGRESAGVAQLDGHGVSEACGVPWRRESSGVPWRLWKEWRNGAEVGVDGFRCKQGDILEAHLGWGGRNESGPEAEKSFRNRVELTQQNQRQTP